jgi:hypothetical protein
MKKERYEEVKKHFLKMLSKGHLVRIPGDKCSYCRAQRYVKSDGDAAFYFHRCTYADGYNKYEPAGDDLLNYILGPKFNNYLSASQDLDRVTFEAIFEEEELMDDFPIPNLGTSCPKTRDKLAEAGAFDKLYPGDEVYMTNAMDPERVRLLIRYKFQLGWSYKRVAALFNRSAKISVDLTHKLMRYRRSHWYYDSRFY